MDKVWEAIKNFFVKIWEYICEGYKIYDGFIHSLFPDQLGDLVVGVINIGVAVLIVVILTKAAFTTRSGEN